jgi:hypothetical protein
MNTTKKLFRYFSGKRFIDKGLIGSNPGAPIETPFAVKCKAEMTKAQELGAALEEFINGLGDSVIIAELERRRKNRTITLRMIEAFRSIGFEIDLEVEHVALKPILPRPTTACIGCGQAAQEGKITCRRCKKEIGKRKCKWCLKPLKVGQICEKHEK